MSGLSNPEIQQLKLERIANCVDYSANVLYLFDSCVTFPREVDAIWGRRWTIMTWLYASTRYSAVLKGIMIFVLAKSLSLENCKATQSILDTFDAIQYLCLALFAALRVYALLDGKVRVPLIVLFLNLVPLATNIVNFDKSVVVNDVVSCNAASTLSGSVRFGLSLGTRISVTIGDILVLLVTWSKTAKLYREAQRLKIKAPLATLLFRDGTFYFIILLILNVLQVIEHIFPSLSTMGISQPFFETVPQIIICRFILSLRKVEPPAGNSESWASSHCHSVSLRFVGNAGESLQFDADSEEEEEFNFDEDYVHAEESNVTTSDAIEDKGRRDIDIESI